jgi:hypothetical protein
MSFHKLFASTLILGLSVLGGCSEPADKPVSFQKDVMPIFKSSCAECHTPPNGEGYQKTGLSLANHADLMKGTKMGPVIVPGQSLNSNLNRLIEGRPGVDPSIQMPHGKVKLPEAQALIIRKWVDQGAKNN